MWAYNETFYQIYPIGFCGAPVHNDGVTVPRIRKIADWSEYLEELGIGSIILNPIFESDNHGYDTRDYKTIDCRLGTNEDFIAVCKELHAHHVKIMLDGVFNHVGRGFWAFRDVQEKKWDSPYKDWFHISFDGNSCYNDGFWYEGWEGHFELVKLNLQNPAVVDYLLECVRFWIEEFDIDGLRLDVAYSLDHNFMRRLRCFCEELKPGFALIGEVLFGDYNLIVNDEMLHSCTNYECYKGIHSSFNSMNLFEIAHSLNRQYGPEQWCIYRGKHLMNFVDNHDVTRIASILTNPEHLPLICTLFTGQTSKEGIFMRYSYEFKLLCVDLYKSGIYPDTPNGTTDERFKKNVREWARMVDSNGPEVLKHKVFNKVWSPEEKLSLVSQVIAGKSRTDVALKAGINPGMLYQWVQKYKTIGYNGLVESRKGRPPQISDMKKSTNPSPLTESEREELIRLRAENEYIKAENEVIKKGSP